MLNQAKHQLIMGRILQDVYTEPAIASWLGFKGGTCARLFYGLPRFSVDLDFDFLAEENTLANQERLLAETKRILSAHGELKESYIKYHTVFLFLSYGKDDHNIKFEVNIRPYASEGREQFELQECLNVPMLVAKRSYLFSCKLAALASRKRVVMRDIYDVWFFAKNNWDFDIEALKLRVGDDIKGYLDKCIALIEQVKDNQILQGLGELLGQKEKVWVKANLRKEAVLLLRNYQAVLG